MKVKFANKWYEVAMVQYNFGKPYYEIYDEPDTDPEHTDWITHPEEVFDEDEFVSGKFLTCLTNFGKFKKGETYWLEYIGNDTFIGRSDNILNEKFHISEFELRAFFDDGKLTNLDILLSQWFYSMRTWGLLGDETNEQFCDRFAHKAKKELINLINTNCQDEIVPQSLKSKGELYT